MTMRASPNEMIDAATKMGVASIVSDLSLHISKCDVAEAEGSVLTLLGVRCVAVCEHAESCDFEASLGFSKIQARSLCKRIVELAESSGVTILAAAPTAPTLAGAKSSVEEEERTAKVKGGRKRETWILLWGKKEMLG